MSLKIGQSLFLLICGLFLGICIRYFDLYTQNLGNVFSQVSVWILLGTLISIYSSTPKHAMGNILPFCLGMLMSYYGMAVLTHGVYSENMIIGWSLVALCSPLFAYVTWFSKESNFFAKLIGFGIIVVSVLSSVLLFDRLRWYDYLIDGLLIYFLLFKKISRPKYGKKVNRV